jgi:hypothetical protein
MAERSFFFENVGNVYGIGIHAVRIGFLFSAMTIQSSFFRTIVWSQVMNQSISNLAIVTMMSKAASKVYTYRKFVTLWNLLEITGRREKYVVASFFLIFTSNTVFLAGSLVYLTNYQHQFDVHSVEIWLFAIFVIYASVGGLIMTIRYLSCAASIPENLVGLLVTMRRQCLTGKGMKLNFSYYIYIYLYGRFTMNDMAVIRNHNIYLCIFLYKEHTEMKKDCSLNSVRFFDFVCDQTVLKKYPLSKWAQSIFMSFLLSFSLVYADFHMRKIYM